MIKQDLDGEESKRGRENQVTEVRAGIRKKRDRRVAEGRGGKEVENVGRDKAGSEEEGLREATSPPAPAHIAPRQNCRRRRAVCRSLFRCRSRQTAGTCAGAFGHWRTAWRHWRPGWRVCGGCWRPASTPRARRAYFRAR